MRLLCAVAMPLLFVAFFGCTPRGMVEEVHPGGAPLEELPAAAFTAADWPWWRGPTRNGIAADQSAPVRWSAGENVVWKTPLPGRGHSSPTVMGERIYLATADDSAQTQSVVALDRGSGAIVWEQVLNRGGFPRAMHSNSTHANGTIACDGERLFIAFLHHDAVWAYALDPDGALLWEQKLGAFASEFGYAPSPVVYKSLLIVAADNKGGGYLAAVHRRTGKLVWRKARPATSSYSSPVVAEIGGRPQLLISGCGMTAAYNPDTGAELWTCTGPTEATCGTMVWDGELVFASGGFPGSQTMGVDAASGAQVWSNSAKCYEQSLLAHDGSVYAVTNSGAFCWNAADGSERWRGRLNGKFSASPVLAAGHIYVSNEAGTTYVLTADPARFEVVAENQLGDEAFATPTICGGRIYLRVAERSGGVRQEWLYCIAETGRSQSLSRR